ncbi:restriction endonuclease subunit R [Thermosipho sp. 1244]|uniref:restriction endonuclease subunit R n=1 Tax=Thermosipho sp. 1244 TaxID=1755816 RepID=UPI001BDEF478|nr:restriction endonuclease subunit R [Thermosipho sp. 1244]MBT1248695.1 restriction endonuclease subunit R [Thermosipho sp. 1244]
MSDELAKLINEFKKDRRLLSFDKAATKQAVILRLLKALDWDPFNIDEVYPEYSVGNKRVDYTLRHNGKNKVFIEVRKVNEDLENFQEQLLSCSFQEGVELAILTNGISWWFYLPSHVGSGEQRKFCTIEIYDQNSEDIINKFEEFLSKENVISGKALESAENLYKNKQKQYLIKETLLKAWEKIITEPDELLIELLAEMTEKLCGYKPDNEIVKEFLKKVGQEVIMVRPKKEMLSLVQSLSTQISPLSSDYTGKSIVAFTFKKTRYSVRSWKEMLIKITNLMLSAHRTQFDKVLNLRGRKRPYFTKNPNELRIPERINNTQIYVETNLSANSIVKLSKSIILLFGYKEEDLHIEIR